MPSILGDQIYYNFLYVDIAGLLCSNNCSIFALISVKSFLRHWVCPTWFRLYSPLLLMHIFSDLYILLQDWFHYVNKCKECYFHAEKWTWKNCYQHQWVYWTGLLNWFIETESRKNEKIYLKLDHVLGVSSRDREHNNLFTEAWAYALLSHL